MERRRNPLRTPEEVDGAHQPPSKTLVMTGLRLTPCWFAYCRRVVTVTDTAWLVIGKEYNPEPADIMKGYWRYLLLGPGPRLRWHEGNLGWIRRVT